jgi:hypothetical protein
VRRTTEVRIRFILAFEDTLHRICGFTGNGHGMIEVQIWRDSAGAGGDDHELLRALRRAAI